MIGGNTLRNCRSVYRKRIEIGEGVKRWKTVHQLAGFLDLSSGDSKYTTYNAKVQESSHIFMCDWQQVGSSVKAGNSRLLVNNEVYDVMLIDDPIGIAPAA